MHRTTSSFIRVFRLAQLLLLPAAPSLPSTFLFYVFQVTQGLTNTPSIKVNREVFPHSKRLALPTLPHLLLTMVGLYQCHSSLSTSSTVPTFWDRKKTGSWATSSYSNPEEAEGPVSGQHCRRNHTDRFVSLWSVERSPDFTDLAFPPEFFFWPILSLKKTWSNTIISKLWALTP